MDIIENDEQTLKQFNILSCFACYRCSKFSRAYKHLRTISTAQDLNNWALMGCIMSKEEDPSFSRSYFKRLLQKTTLQMSPFIVMILGNNFLQKQQFDLALKHFWVLHQCFDSGSNAYLNFMLAIVNLCMSYQRTN